MTDNPPPTNVPSRSSTPTSGTSNNNGGRSWLEGTIDAMLSGLSVSSPTNQQQQGASPSTSTSPPESKTDASVDASVSNDAVTTTNINNESSSRCELLQGDSSPEEGIELSSLEHELRNQVEQLRMQLVETQSVLEQKDQDIAVLEARCNVGEARLREQHDELIRSQSTSVSRRKPTTSSSFTEDDKKEDSDEVYVEDDNDNGTIKEQLSCTRDALFRAESALVQLQNDHNNILTRHNKSLEELHDSQQTVELLQSQVADFSSQVSELTNHVSKLQADAETYKQSANELRASKNVQEQEIALLKAKLEDAVQEIEVREMEATTSNNSTVQQELMGARQTIQNLQEQLRKEQENRPRPSSPLVRMAPLDELDDISALDGLKQNELDELRNCIRGLELKAQTAEHELSVAHAALKSAVEEKTNLVRSHQGQLQQIKQASAQSEATLRDQLADMEVELSGIRQRKSGESPSQQRSRAVSINEAGPQQGGSDENDDAWQKKLEDAQEAYAQQLQDLQLKLEDRDTTISALVKSSVALEQQLVASNLELNAIRSKMRGNNTAEAGLDVFVSQPASSEEVDELKAVLAKLQSGEKQHIADVDRLQNQLRDVKVEASQLRSRLEACKSENLLLRSQMENDMLSDGGSVANSSIISSSPQVQIQERDNAIANLVQQSIEQDRLVSDLQSRLVGMQQQIESLRSRPSSTVSTPLEASHHWEEIQELRRETEIFAGQVIEQDEEIEALTKSLHVKEERIASLEREIQDLQTTTRSTRDVADATAKSIQLSSEIDELTEANNVLRDEVRMLRRKSIEMESMAQEVDRMKQDVQEKAKRADDLQQSLDTLLKDKDAVKQAFEEYKASSVRDFKENIDRVKAESSETIRKLETKLKESDRTILSLRAASSLARSNNVDELELENLRSEVVSLQRNLQHQTSTVDSAKNTIRELEQMLAERNATEAAAWEEEKEELLAEVESLTKQLDDAHQELNTLEEQRIIIEDFKGKLEAADEAREESEKAIVDNYERKLSLLKLDKDVTIDKLRKELSETKASFDEEVNACHDQIKQLNAQLSDCQNQMSYEIQEREAQIFALERTLEAQEQLVTNMKSEMDILQGNMENRAVTRREEIEIMQQELVDLTTLAAQQERDIRSLQGKLQDQKQEYDAQITKLKQTIALMESEEEADHRTAADLKTEIRVREVKERLEKLKWHNTSLSEENELLRERLLRAEDLSTKATEDRTRELTRVLAERDIKIQMLEAELKELKVTTIQPVQADADAPSGKSTICSPLPASGKSNSARRLGFLSRRSSSTKRSNQS